MPGYEQVSPTGSLLRGNVEDAERAIADRQELSEELQKLQTVRGQLVEQHRAMTPGARGQEARERKRLRGIFKDRESAEELTAERVQVGMFRDFTKSLTFKTNFERQNVLEGGWRDLNVPRRVSLHGCDVRELNKTPRVSMTTFTDFSSSAGKVVKVTGVPVKGFIKRITVIVRTAPTGATLGRLVIMERAYLDADDASNGYTGIKGAAEQQYMVFDSDSNGTPSIDVDGTPVVPFDRVADGDGYPYQNRDDTRGATFTALGDVFDGQKRGQVYLYMELNGNLTVQPVIDVLLSIVEEG